VRDPTDPRGTSAERWRRASALLVDALDLPEDQRLAFVRVRAGTDSALREEVMSLLAAHGREGILDGTFTPPVTDDDLESRIGEALSDRYRILERLGEGGSAVVFLAWEHKHERRVVLKVLRPESALLFGPDRFLTEVRLASALSHPHIIPFIDSGQAAGLPYYVMPHVEGTTLADARAGTKPPPLETLVPWLRDVAEALAYAHQHGVVHRDLKPGNILCAGGHAYLLDFGVAKASREVAAGALRTRVGFVPGTPRYMAPEQVAGRTDVGPATDVFAWGQVAYECLTGAVLPAPWAVPEARLSAVLVRTHPELPRALAELVGAALSPVPEARPKADQIAEALARLTAISDADGSWRAGDARRASRSGKSGWALAVAATGAILLWGVAHPGTPATEKGMQLGPIAVAEFRNETGDPSLDFVGRLAGDWLTQGLQELELAPIVPWPSALAASSEARAAAESDPLPRIVRATGAATVVVGSVYRVGDELRFQAEIVDSGRRQVRAALPSIRAPVDRPEDGIAELRDRVMGSLSVMSGVRAADLPGLASRAPTFEAYRIFDRAMTLYLAQAYGQATPVFLEAHARDTTFTLSLLYGATTAWNQGDRSMADSLVSIVARRRDRLTPYEDLRWQFLDATLRNDGPEALRALRRSVEIAPGSQASYNLGRQAVMMNRPHEALDALGQIDPDRGPLQEWAQYWTQVTHALHLVGRHVEEAGAAGEMVRRHPDRPLGAVLEARGYAASGDIEGLEAALERSAVRPPRTYWSHGAALVVAGEELLAHGAAAAAALYLLRGVDWLEQQIATDPDFAAHRYWLGSALYDLERWDESSRVFEALLVESPTSTAYLGMVALTAARVGDAARAWAHLEQPRWGYEVGDRLMYAARTAAILGDRERALALVSEALERGSVGYPWMHASGHHDFVLLRADERVRRLLDQGAG